MTDFTLDLISKGEELTSILIQLEAQWPQTMSYVDLSWLEHVTQRGLVPTFTQMVGKEGDDAALNRTGVKD